MHTHTHYLINWRSTNNPHVRSFSCRYSFWIQTHGPASRWPHSHKIPHTGEAWLKVSNRWQQEMHRLQCFVFFFEPFSIFLYCEACETASYKTCTCFISYLLSTSCLKHVCETRKKAFLLFPHSKSLWFYIYKFLVQIIVVQLYERTLIDLT